VGYLISKMGIYLRLLELKSDSEYSQVHNLQFAHVKFDSTYFLWSQII
jgi:hypothetical protein